METQTSQHVPATQPDPGLRPIDLLDKALKVIIRQVVDHELNHMKNRFVTRTDLDDLTEDFDDKFATKDDIDDLATKRDLEDLIEDTATKEDMRTLVSGSEFDELVAKVDKISTLLSKLQVPDLSGYVTKADLIAVCTPKEIQCTTSQA